MIEPLIAAVTSLERSGQLSAIEIFEHCGNAAAGPVLTQLLSSEHNTVREWSALALAQSQEQEVPVRGAGRGGPAWRDRTGSAG